MLELLAKPFDPAGLAPTVMQHAGTLDRDQPALHHGVEHGQEAVDFFGTVDDFDDYGMIVRKWQKVVMLQTSGMAKSQRPTQHCGTGQIVFARSIDNSNK